MENNPKKSKAFIITFILILLLLVAGYFLFKNRDQLFGTKGSSSISKIFSPLLGTSKNKDAKVIPDETKVPTDEGNKLTGTVITDVNGNKLVLAEAGEDLKKGDVLYIARFNANKQPVVMKAIANDKNKSLVFGVAAEDIKMGSLGNILIEGILIGVPTNKREGTLWAVKNILYLSDKTYGGMTKNPPVTPSYTVPVGSVLKVDAVNGQIVVGKLTGAEQTNLNSLNSQFLNSAMGDFRDYWNSIFGNNSNENISTGSNFPLNSITIPTGSNINTGTNTGSISTDGPGTNTGTGTDANTGTTKTEENICKDIEQNPLTFTDDEKAQLAILLRKFYLVSSTLKTSEDISTIYNEIDQQTNFIAQIEDLTSQCYDQITDQKLASQGWVRNGNPWYTKTSGGAFPYTDTNIGYLDYNKLGSAGYSCKDVSGYYYGTLTSDFRETSTKWWGKVINAVVGTAVGIAGVDVNTGLGEKTTASGSAGESCAQFNTFSGYGSCNYGDVDLQIRDGSMPNENILKAGCKWKDGVDLRSTERILNIW